jgi:UDP-N-acetyl-D-glucosamine dehydrogenase
LQNGFIPTNSINKLSLVDVIIICVPTPLNEKNEPDLSYILNTMKSIEPFLKKNQILILESTTYPGTTKEKIVPFIQNNNFIIGQNYYIGYSPERVDPANNQFNLINTPKIVSGYTHKCLSLVKELYCKIVNEVIPVGSLEIAEMAKILENIHRAVNIGLVNEMKIIADKMNIDIFEVINASSTKPFGFTTFYPGPGLGGHCIPIDPFYLSWKAEQYGVDARFIKLAGVINSSMPEWVVKKLTDVLQKEKILFNKAKVLILGIAYKKNVGDCREAPSLKIIELLQAKKIKTDYYDPYVPKMTPTRKYNYKMSSVKLSARVLSIYDVVLLVTDHDIFDYDLIEKKSRVIVDTRGRFKKGSKIVKA